MYNIARSSVRPADRRDEPSKAKNAGIVKWLCGVVKKEGEHR